MLDTHTDQKSKAKLGNIICQKFIYKNEVRFFDECLADYSQTGIEVLFDKEDYLKVFNQAFTEDVDIKLSNLDATIKPITSQINKHLNVQRFNHY